MLLLLLPSSALGALLQTTPAASRPRLNVQHSRVRRLHATAGGDGEPKQVNQEKVDSLLRALSKADGVEVPTSKGDTTTTDQASASPFSLDGLKEEWGRLRQGEGVSCSLLPLAHSPHALHCSTPRRRLASCAAPTVCAPPSQETYEFVAEFVPTFAFFLAIRLLIVEPRYIPSLSMFPLV